MTQLDKPVCPTCGSSTHAGIGQGICEPTGFAPQQPQGKAKRQIIRYPVVLNEDIDMAYLELPSDLTLGEVIRLTNMIVALGTEAAK